MLTLALSLAIGGLPLPVGSAAGLPRSPADQFGEIFLVFAGLGTLVGIVVIGYTLLNAYKYRRGSGNGEKKDVVRPELGEKPGGGGGGKKLFLSFGISAIIVLSLIVWTYSALLYVENAPEEDITIEVEGEQFSWRFIYPNGETTFNELRLPKDQVVKLEVTSTDVFHNFGIPDFRVKADAIPGQTTEKWFIPDETGTVQAHCYELCGAGHSGMDADVIVMEQGEFEDWYAGTGSNDTQATVGGDAALAGGDA